jgi:hypothetical protein
MGGHLVEITSQSEDDFVQSLGEGESKVFIIFAFFLMRMSVYHL